MAELSALVVKLWRAGKTGRIGKQSFAMRPAGQAPRGVEANYFALDEGDEDGEGDDDNDDGRMELADDERGVEDEGKALMLREK